jgi:ATP-dependent Clp protease ATP-binding subunit ClpA
MNLTAIDKLPTVDQILAFIVLIALVLDILWWLLSRRYKPEATNPYFDAEAIEVAKASAELKDKIDYKEIMPAHLLWALFHKPGRRLSKFLHQQKLDPLEGKKLLEEMFLKSRAGDRQRFSYQQPYLSKRVKQVIDQASINIKQRKASKITPIDLFEALLEKTASSENDTVYNEVKFFATSVGISLVTTLAQLKKTANETPSDSPKR